MGNPLAFLLSSGNDHDSKYAVPLLNQIDIKGSNILGDKAYGAKAIRDYVSFLAFIHIAAIAILLK